MRIYEEDVQNRMAAFVGIPSEILIDQLSHIKAKSESIGIRVSDNAAWSTDILAILYQLSYEKQFVELPQPLMNWLEQFNKDRNSKGITTPKIVSIWQ